MHEETRFMLRLPMVGLGLEVELLPYFTFMAQAEIGYRNMIYSISGDNRLEAELRYYYGSKKTGVRNMSGNYFAAGISNKTLSVLPVQEIEHSGVGYYAKWGIQRRYLGNGLIDISLIIGHEEQPFQFYTSDRPGYFFETNASLGFGLVFGQRAALDRDRLCPVLKCFEKESWLFKVNVANILSAFRDDFKTL